MLPFTTDEEKEIAQKAADRLAHRAIAMDGTCLSRSFILFDFQNCGLT